MKSFSNWLARRSKTSCAVHFSKALRSSQSALERERESRNLKRRWSTLASSVAPKTIAAVTRLPVDRAFSIKGFGTVVTGTLISGQLAVGDQVEVLPAGIKTRVRNVQVHGHDTERAAAGQRTAINLQGLNVEQVERGSVLAPAGSLRATSMVDAGSSIAFGVTPVAAARAREPASRNSGSDGRAVILRGSGFRVPGSTGRRLGTRDPEPGTRNPEPGTGLLFSPAEVRSFSLARGTDYRASGRSLHY